MSSEHQNGGGNDGTRGPSQLHMWGLEAEELSLGMLEDPDGPWEIFLLVERSEAGLARGKISFRRDDNRFDTAPVIVEDTEDAVIRRARNMSDRLLRQFLTSARE